MATQKIIGPVGQGGIEANAPEDVRKVQTLLKGIGVYQGRVDALCGPKTIAAIRTFQARFMKRPDGLIEPHGNTWKRLTGQIPVALPLPPESTPTDIRLSEKGHWFIFHIEVGGLINITKTLHWPKGKSGVTIGPGYDMKERLPAVIKRDMMSIGLPESVATTFSGGSKLESDAAEAFCKNHKHLANLSKNQQYALLKLIAPHYEGIVKRNISVPLAQHEYDALVCFAYNPGASIVPVTKRIAEGRMEEAMSIIMSRVPSPSNVNYNGLLTRRRKEVDLFKSGVYANVTEA